MRRSRCNGPAPWRWTSTCRPQIDAYRRKRDLIVAGLADDYEVVQPGGAFYVFPESPLGHRHGVRHPGDREAPVADHSRQRLQPPRHPLPHFLRGRRRGDRTGDRGTAKAGTRPVRRRVGWHMGKQSSPVRISPVFATRVSFACPCHPRNRRTLFCDVASLPLPKSSR